MKKFILLIVLLLSIFISNLFAIEVQERNNWCWASSIQDVIKQGGVNQSQSQIVTRLTGWPENRPAYVSELVPLIRSYGFKAWRAGRPASPRELYRTLMTGWKVIAFVRPSNGRVGHFIVLQGLQNNGIVVSDPWTGQTRIYSINQLYYKWRWADSVIVGR